MLTIFGWNFETEERCKEVHCVDLGESFPTSIYLQKSASIQPRTSPSKFGEKFNSTFIRLLSGNVPAEFPTSFAPLALRTKFGFLRSIATTKATCTADSDSSFASQNQSSAPRKKRSIPSKVVPACGFALSAVTTFGNIRVNAWPAWTSLPACCWQQPKSSWSSVCCWREI